MDYKKLRGFYGRLMGIEESLPERKTDSFDAVLATDYNAIVDEVAIITEENLDNFKIIGGSWMSASHRKMFYGAETVKIKQFISYLRYTYNFDEKILEVGSLINAIENQELKDRCLDLLSATGKFDRVINQATLVLEDSIRKKSGITDKEGTKLVNEVFKEVPSDSVLIIDGEPEEHQGFGHICRGIMLGFRNLTHHKMINKITREDALKLCGFIDVLLKVLDSAKKNK